MRRLLLTLSTVLLLPALGSSGCKKEGGLDSASASAASENRVREVPAPVEGQVVVEVDVDGDGRPDVWNLYQEHEDGSRTRVRKDTDLDRDGRPDIISEFDAAGALRIERLDGDFDGVYEWTDHYQDGRRVFAEVDTNLDGVSDVFYYYSAGENPAGVLERRERDTDFNGMVDLWERYGPDGALVVSARDTDGDGTPDVRSE